MKTSKFKKPVDTLSLFQNQFSSLKQNNTLGKKRGNIKSNTLDKQSKPNDNLSKLSRSSALIASTLLAVSGLLSSCVGGGFQSGSAELTSTDPGTHNPTPGGSGSGGGGSGSFSDPNLAWNRLESELSGTVRGGQYDGNLIFVVDRDRQSLVVMIPQIPFLFAPSQSFNLNPTAEGLRMELIPGADGLPRIAIVVPLKLLSREASFTSYNRLPNGDPLPFLPSGERRGFAVAFPSGSDQVIHLYFGVTAFAIFIEVPRLNQVPLFFGVPILNQKGNRQNGFFSLIPQKSGSHAGIYVATRVPNELAILIDELVKF
jgi:hypothetical protein